MTTTPVRKSPQSFKVVLLGDRSAGKTCLMKRYFSNEFNGNEVATISGGFDSRKFIIDGKEYQMGVWDTSGEERFQAVTRMFYRRAYAALLCYDVTLLGSFRRLHYWITELRNVEPNCRIYLCAMKRDLLQSYEANPKISYVESYAREHGAKFFMTSSMYGENVDDLFNEILEDYICDKRNTPESTGTIRLPNARFLRRRRCKKCCTNG